MFKKSKGIKVEKEINMRNFLRKQLSLIAVLALVAITTIIAGCLQPAYTSRPASEKTYQLVDAAKLGIQSFAVEYYGKGVETDVPIEHIFSGSAGWTPSRLRTTDWIDVWAGRIGLVVPKTSSCADIILSANDARTKAPGTPVYVHVWGTVLEPAAGVVGSVIVVDKCRLK